MNSITINRFHNNIQNIHTIHKIHERGYETYHEIRINVPNNTDYGFGNRIVFDINEILNVLSKGRSSLSEILAMEYTRAFMV